LLGVKSPPFYSQARHVKSQSHLQDAPFIVDKRNKKVNVDFGNSFQIRKDGSFNVDNKQVYVALSLDDHSPVTCNSELFWLGKVLYHQPMWYTNFTGIQSFPALGVLSDEEMDIIRNHPLAVVEVSMTYWFISYIW